MATKDNATLSRDLYDAFNRADFDRVLLSVAEDVEGTFIPTGQTFHGLQGFEQFMRGHKTAFPDIEIEVTNQISAGDYVINEFVGRGTHTGPLRTPSGVIEPTGRPVALKACEVCRFNEGKLAMVHNYQDMVSLLGQLGLLPEPQATS